MNIKTFITQIPDEEKTPLVLQLLEVIQLQSEQIQNLRDEIARLKGQKPKPDIKPSALEKNSEQKSKNKNKKRAGSKKRRKTKHLQIHDEKIIPPDEIPAGSRFKGYQDYIVQDIKFEPYNIRYRLARWQGPEGEYIIAKLPEEIMGSHFGVTLRSFILYQYYHAHVTQPLVLEQLSEIGIEISSGEINRIITEDKERFHREKEEILKVGLKVSKYINVDDTGARHNGKNGYCTHIGNEIFACFESTESKSRINFLKILRAGSNDYVISPDAICYMGEQKLPQQELLKFSSLLNTAYETEQAWQEKLTTLERCLVIYKLQQKAHYWEVFLSMALTVTWSLSVMMRVNLIFFGIHYAGFMRNGPSISWLVLMTINVRRLNKAALRYGSFTKR